jgi:hypothetical protein
MLVHIIVGIFDASCAALWFVLLHKIYEQRYGLYMLTAMAIGAIYFNMNSLIDANLQVMKAMFPNKDNVDIATRVNTVIHSPRLFFYAFLQYIIGISSHIVGNTIKGLFNFHHRLCDILVDFGVYMRQFWNLVWENFKFVYDFISTRVVSLLAIPFNVAMETAIWMADKLGSRAQQVFIMMKDAGNILINGLLDSTQEKIQSWIGTGKTDDSTYHKAFIIVFTYFILFVIPSITIMYYMGPWLLQKSIMLMGKVEGWLKQTFNF